jgi:hypothetical protein
MTYTCRRCDSRNLNLSPLCDLSSNMQPQAWGEEVAEVYKNTQLPDYIQRLERPGRSFYEDSKAVQGEIITSLTQVG